MNIGIVSNINPSDLRDYLYNNQAIPDTKIMASSVQALVTGFIELGHNVVVFSPASAKCTHGKKVLVLNGQKLRIYLVRVLPKIDYLIRHLYLPQAITSCIRKELAGLDVLHSQWTYECSAATVCYSDIKPTFCSVRDWWPVQNEYFLKSNYHQRILWGKTKRKMFIKTMRDSRITFVANSEYTKEQILSLYPNYTVPIIPNPIKEKYIAKEKEFQFNNVFVSIANSLFEKRKNISVLIEAFDKYHVIHKDARLILIGDFSIEDEMYKDWQSKGLLEGIEFCGILPHAKVLEKLDEASVMIHPSLEETFGNILLEGMARKLLVVGGDKSGAVPSVLGNGKYGLLCNVSSAQDIYTVLESIQEKEDHYAPIVFESELYLLNNLTEKAVAQRHIELYMRFLSV